MRAPRLRGNYRTLLLLPLPGVVPLGRHHRREDSIIHRRTMRWAALLALVFLACPARAAVVEITGKNFDAQARLGHLFPARDKHLPTTKRSGIQIITTALLFRSKRPLQYRLLRCSPASAVPKERQLDALCVTCSPLAPCRRLPRAPYSSRCSPSGVDVSAAPHSPMALPRMLPCLPSPD